MQNWIKHLMDFLSISFRNNMIIAITTGIIIFVPSNLLEKMYLDELYLPYMGNIIGFAFLFSTVGLIIEIASVLWKKITVFLNKTSKVYFRRREVIKNFKTLDEVTLNTLRLTVNFEGTIGFADYSRIHRSQKKDEFLCGLDLYRALNLRGLADNEDTGDYIYIEHDAFNIIKSNKKLLEMIMSTKEKYGELFFFEQEPFDDEIPF